MHPESMFLSTAYRTPTSEYVWDYGIGCSLSPIRFHINMDEIAKKSESRGGVKSGDCAVQRLLFADDLAPLESSPKMACGKLFCRNENRYHKNRNHVPLCLYRQPKQCSLQVGGVPLKQSEKLKDLGISFTSDGKLNSEFGMSKCSNTPFPPIYGAETWALHLGKAIHLQISLCSNSD